MTKVLGRNCLVCNKFFKPRDNLKTGKYCGHNCYWKDMKNRRGENSSAWKGERAKNSAIHKWMSINLEKPDKCFFCENNIYRLQWANISGDYLRDPDDYICLCQKCHSMWDRIAIKKWRTQKEKRVRLCAIDLDGVLIKWGSGELIGRPKKDSVDTIKWMISMGIEPYVLTARETWEWADIVIWLYYYGFPGMMVTNKKKKGTSIYIDDRAIRFTNWEDIRKYFL